VTTRTALAPRSRPTANAQRRWASGRELDHIEQLAFGYRAALPPGTFLRILPAAVDANVLLRVVARLARGMTSDLVSAAREGVIRIYVGETIVAEVEEHLADLVRTTRVPLAQLERVWRDEVCPHLRVVQTGTFDHPDLSTIIARDPDDRPTAVLSLFIGARLTWSYDKDLHDTGFAERLNVEIVIASRNVGRFDLSAHLALRISEESISAAGRGLMRAIEGPGATRNVVIAVVLVAATALTVALIKDPQRVKQTAARVAEVGIEGFQHMAKFRGEEGGRLPAIPTPATTEPLPLRLAHALAFAPAPLATGELVEILARTGAPVPTAEIETTLGSYRAFVRGRHGWQLGAW